MVFTYILRSNILIVVHHSHLGHTRGDCLASCRKFVNDILEGGLPKRSRASKEEAVVVAVVVGRFNMQTQGCEGVS